MSIEKMRERRARDVDIVRRLLNGEKTEDVGRRHQLTGMRCSQVFGAVMAGIVMHSANDTVRGRARPDLAHARREKDLWLAELDAQAQRWGVR